MLFEWMWKYHFRVVLKLMFYLIALSSNQASILKRTLERIETHILPLIYVYVVLFTIFYLTALIKSYLLIKKSKGKEKRRRARKKIRANLQWEFIKQSRGIYEKQTFITSRNRTNRVIANHFESSKFLSLVEGEDTIITEKGPNSSVQNNDSKSSK